MFKKMIRSTKMRRAAGTTPDANRRAIDFDKKDRRKRTRADSKMRRVAADALTTKTGTGTAWARHAHQPCNAASSTTVVRLELLLCKRRFF
jgi:hypothetical protein